jgi:glycosyltransferase involved in cell wall biosynthesis
VVILLIHNFYQQLGGEDRIFEAESRLLEDNGHRVLRYTVHNDQIAGMHPLGMAAVSLWNRSVYSEIRTLIRTERPDVIHFHNTFPLISPAAYYAAKAEHTPVVQGLPNYRLLCPNAIFLRQGRICEDCMGRKVPWPGVIHTCYRNNRAASAVVATMLTVHRALRTWTKMVDVYIALTEFARQKFIQGGLPADRIVVKPNFVYPDPGPGRGQGDYALFVGRLSPEKGLDTLLEASKCLGEKMRLKIVGEGPLAPQVAEAARHSSRIDWQGGLSNEQVMAAMKDAQVLLFPSVWYEGFPVVIVEAYAAGLPVIASQLGSMSSLINPGHTGLFFRPGSSEDLAAQVEWALGHSGELARMRREARQEFEARYTAERNYEQLLDIYRIATERARSRNGRSASV